MKKRYPPEVISNINALKKVIREQDRLIKRQHRKIQDMMKIATRK